MFPRVLLAASLLAAPAQADRPYVGVFLGSWHAGTDDLNGVNPGLTYGRRWAAARPGMEWHMEGGVFLNSYEEVSPILLGGLSARVADLPGGSLRIGVSAGTAYYQDLSDDLRDTYGIPAIGPFIPLVAATAAYRTERVEWRLTALPSGGDVDAVVNLSLAVPF